jgi:hypothetical protein
MQLSTFKYFLGITSKHKTLKITIKFSPKIQIQKRNFRFKTAKAIFLHRT